VDFAGTVIPGKKAAVPDFDYHVIEIVPVHKPEAFQGDHEQYYPEYIILG